ncbi:hypothetical protein HAX54_035898, partial [Datura stramonium]|nr:hypothetical protein [Datura stramonium]
VWCRGLMTELMARQPSDDPLLAASWLDRGIDIPSVQRWTVTCIIAVGPLCPYMTENLIDGRKCDGPS